MNARGLEIRLRLPSGFEHLEVELRSVAREHLSRGSCFFTLQIEGQSEQSRLVLNEEALALVVAAARRVAALEGVAMPSADGLLAIPGVMQESAGALDSELAEKRDAELLKGFAAAVGQLKRARLEEGARLAAVLAEQLLTVARLVEAAEAIAVEAPDALKARIKEQVAQLSTERELDPDRLHQEALLAASRADVREELDRLKSHVAGARDLLRSGEPVGRKLEFLAQEFNREANTLCSKAFDRRLTAIGLDLKAVIDQFREQVQNLE